MSSGKGNGSKDKRAYTAHKIKFDPFKFVSLNRMEIEKSIYNHTKVAIEGVIDEENMSDYEKYLKATDPKLVITYANQDNRILFKGIVEEFEFIHKKQDYYLTLNATSYSVFLERVKNNRIYQNKGRTYNQVFSRLMEDNPQFYITFANDELGETPLVSKDYPLLLQYKENEWDFLKRIASYIKQPLIVDDTKDPEETINILVGLHAAAAKELNNITGGLKRMKDKKKHKYTYHDCYKAYQHKHFRSGEIFDIGKKIKYRLNNQDKETVDLAIIKNKIYVEKSVLCSDLTLVRESDLRIIKEQREVPITGRSFRAKVRRVHKDHTVQVKFLDIYNKYNPINSFRFPIDRPYTTGYFAPEKGDIVDIYFKGKNEKHATLKSSTTDNDEKIEQMPADKLIITPGGYKIRINDDNVLITSKDEKSLVRIEEDLIKVISDKDQVEMTTDEINMQRNDSNVVMDDSKVKVESGGKKMEVSSGSIDMK
jgi:hypothetical protein